MLFPLFFSLLRLMYDNVSSFSFFFLSFFLPCPSVTFCYLDEALDVVFAILILEG